MRVTPEQERQIKREMVRPLTTLDWLLEAVAALAILLPFAYLLAVWSDLPATVPTHFDVVGNADAHGSRFSFWGLLGVQVALYLLFTFIHYLPARFYNFQVTVTANNIERVAILVLRFARSMKAAVCILFGTLLVATVRIALGQATGLSPWLLGIGAAPLVAAIIWVLTETVRLDRS